MIDLRRTRRDLLKALGLGAAGLPLLAGRSAAQAKAPSNLVCVQAIHGYRMAQWKPALGSLLGQSLPPSTRPLEQHAADLLIATGLTHAGGGAAGAAFGTVFWGLPGVGTSQYKEPNGKTLDQVVADGAQPPFTRRSLALGVQLDLNPQATTLPGGRYAFWSGPGQPIQPQLDPLATYKLLFGAGPGDMSALDRLRFQKKSVLDYVGGSLERFSGRVGTEAKKSIAFHLEAIREIERGLDRVPAAGCNMAPPAIDLADHAQYANILAAQTDLMVAALACGVTRVVTLQLSDASGTSINFGAFVPGVPPLSKSNYKTQYRNWADLAHNPVMDGTDHKVIVDTWWMGRLAALIAKMKAVPHAGGGTLFDQSVILWGNVVEEGGSKDANRKPWVLAARAGGALRTGQHAATAGTPSSGVLAAVCQAMGVTHPFGPVTPGLLA